NNRTHTVTKKTPFEALLGFHPRSGQPCGDSNSPAANDHLEDIREVQKEIKAAIEYAQNIQKEGEARNKKSDRMFKIGDQVWLEATNLKTKRPSKKLDHKHFRPFKIIKQVGAAAYQLQLPPTWTIYNTFNQDLLTKWTEPKHASQKRKAPPPPDLIEGEMEYEVEKILDKHISYGLKED